MGGFDCIGALRASLLSSCNEAVIASNFLGVLRPSKLGWVQVGNHYQLPPLVTISQW